MDVVWAILDEMFKALACKPKNCKEYYALSTSAIYMVGYLNASFTVRLIYSTYNTQMDNFQPGTKYLMSQP